MSNKCASAKSRISKRKRLNSDSRLSKHLPKLNETQVSEQERRVRRSNLGRHERTWLSVQEIASQKALAMTRAEQLRGETKSIARDDPIADGLQSGYNPVRRAKHGTLNQRIRMPRLTRIYTGKGDQGTTSLVGGRRVAKDSLRVNAYGSVDELNSQIGLAISLGLHEDLVRILKTVQNDLFHLGADLARSEEDKQRVRVPQIEPRHVDALEQVIERFTTELGPLENFILPG